MANAESEPDYLTNARETILLTYNMLYYGRPEDADQRQLVTDLCCGAMGLGQVALDQQRRIDALERRLAALEDA